MNLESIKKTIFKIVADFLECDTSLIELHTSLQDQLGIDSTDIVNIYVKLEKIFSVNFRDVLFSEVKTINDLIELVSIQIQKNVIPQI